MYEDNRPKPNGCLTAFLVVLGLFGVVALLHLAIAFFILSGAFKPGETIFGDSSSSSFAINDLPVPRMTRSGDGAMARDQVFDFTGYYYPKTPLRSGNFQLDHIGFGDRDEFSAGESGRAEPTALYLTFADLTSPQIETRQGTMYKRMPVVACTRYSLTRDEIALNCNDPRIGEVAFRGRFNPAYLARAAGFEHDFERSREAASASGDDDDPLVLTGTLTINGQAYPDVAFTYWTGE